MIEQPTNKAVKKAPTAKGAGIFDGDDVIVISTEELKEQAANDGTRPYLADGKAYIRRPDCKQLQKNLTREQRRALKRRGIDID